MKKSRATPSSRNPRPDAELESFPEKGAPPERRVRDAEGLHALYLRFAEEDERSAYNRFLVRDIADGAPPWADEDIEQDGRFNLNFHQSRALLEREKARYTDLIDSVDVLARFFLPEDLFNQDTEKENKQDVIAEEHYHLVRNSWPEFDNNWNTLTSEIAQFAVCAGFFPNEKTWKWKPAGLDDILIPRQTVATEEAVPVMFIRDKMQVHELWGKVKGEKYAKGAGWSPDECRKQLVKATTGNSKKSVQWRRYWNAVQDELANNDIGASYKEDIEIIHGLVREYDGSYSHYIIPEEGDCNDFLFQQPSRYKSANAAFTMFAVNLGRNGTYHSARGMLYLAYPYAQAINRLRNAALDSTSYSMALFLQAPDAESMEDMAIVLNGPVGWLPPEAQVVRERTLPNLAQNALPIIADLDSSLNSNLGMEQYDTGSPSTKYGQKVQQVMEGTLSGTTISIFYRSWKKLLWEQFERIRAIGADNAKFPEVRSFYERCARRGVMPEDIARIERLEPFRAAGQGSASMRLLAFDEAMQTISMLDEVGRSNLLRDRFSMRFGRDLAERYVGSPQRPRFVLDEKLAELENAALKSSPDMAPKPGENDAAHAQVHLVAAMQTVQQLGAALEQGGENLNPAAFQEPLGYVEALLRHAGPHLQNLSVDETRKELFGQLRKAFQQTQAQWTNIATTIQRLTPTEQGQQDFMTKMQMRMEDHRLRMQMLQEDHEAQLARKAQESQQRMQLRRVQTGVKISTRASEQVAQNAAG